MCTLTVLGRFRSGFLAGLGHDRVRSNNGAVIFFSPAEASYLKNMVATADASSSVNERNAAGDANPMSQLIVKVASRWSTAFARWPSTAMSRMSVAALATR